MGFQIENRHGWQRQRLQRFDEVVKEFGFLQNPDEPCVYMKVSGSTIVFLVLYFNDILRIGNNIPTLEIVNLGLEIFFNEGLRSCLYSRH